MKKKIYTSFGILGLLLVFSILPAMAQHPGTINAKIPFAFTVGNKTLPAGEYSIKLPIATGLKSRILIRSDNTKWAVVALTTPIDRNGKLDDSFLTFVKRGDQYFLLQVFAPGIDVGQQLPRSGRFRESQIADQLLSLPSKGNGTEGN